MTSEELNEEVKRRLWRQAYIMTLIICIALVTIAAIFLVICHYCPGFREAFERSTGGKVVDLEPLAILAIYGVWLIVSALAAFPLSVLMYLSTDVYTEKDIIEQIAKEKFAEKTAKEAVAEMEKVVDEYIEKAKNEVDKKVE